MFEFGASFVRIMSRNRLRALPYMPDFCTPYIAQQQCLLNNEQIDLHSRRQERDITERISNRSKIPIVNVQIYASNDMRKSSQKFLERTMIGNRYNHFITVWSL